MDQSLGMMTIIADASCSASISPHRHTNEDADRREVVPHESHGSSDSRRVTMENASASVCSGACIRAATKSGAMGGIHDALFSGRCNEFGGSERYCLLPLEAACMGDEINGPFFTSVRF